MNFIEKILSSSSLIEEAISLACFNSNSSLVLSQDLSLLIFPDELPLFLLVSRCDAGSPAGG